MEHITTANRMIPMSQAIGVRVQLIGPGSPTTHTVREVWGPTKDGQYFAWAVDDRGNGSHISANDQYALLRRVMSLRA